LPGAKVILPGLLVEVGENQEEQQGDNPGHNNHADRNAVHGAETAIPALLMSSL
jgi:hypothetical protein